MRRLAVLVASLGLLLASGLGALVLTDHAVGWLADPRLMPLTGPPDTDTALTGSEFRVRVRTNAEGFRGPALPGPKPPGVYRIVVLGDSFTWGYGVRERQAYPARLAQRLNARQRATRRGTNRVEVVNLGLPGAGPLDYLYHLQRTGLALEPDLVVVGLSANDVNDLYQVLRFGARSPLVALDSARTGAGTSRPWWGRAVESAAPNLYVLASHTGRRFGAWPREASAAPRAAAPAPAAVLAALGDRYERGPEMLERYAALAAADRARVDALLVGQPPGEDGRGALLLAALVDPEAERDGILLRSGERRQAWRDTARTLSRLVRLARRHGAEVLFAVLPAAEQIDRARWPALQSVGFHLDPAMLADTTLPDGVRELAARTGARSVDLVALFRARGGAGRYFVLDEHWNGRGQALAAAGIAARLQNVGVAR